MTIRVFVDSSVFIAAAISARGAARELLLRSVNEQVLLCHSDLVLLETTRNLERKAPAALPHFHELLDALVSKVVTTRAETIAQAAAIIERKDAAIIAGAVQGYADWLVTYDRRHLISQAPAVWDAYRIRVALPEDLLSVLRAHDDEP